MNDYYDKYFDLFLHPGWQQFIEEMSEVLESYELDNCNTYDDFMKTKAARQQLLRIVNFEQHIRLAQENSEQETED